MRLIKLYGKEDMIKIMQEESKRILRSLDRTSKKELREIVFEVNNELKDLRIKLNDIERIMESYENKHRN